MAAHAPVVTPEELDRQRKMGDIADWYRGEPAVAEIQRTGGDVLITVDHLERIIRVESQDGLFIHRTPVEERMEFDRDVLALIKRELRDPERAVILDTSDVAARIGFGKDATRGLSVKIVVIDIGAGEPIDEKIIVKRRPDFPAELHARLVRVPRSHGDSQIVLTTAVAERFVREYLHSNTIRYDQSFDCDRATPVA